MRFSHAVTFPTSKETITAEWLSFALSRNYPGTVVTSVHFGSEAYGTGVKFRLLLDYNPEGHRHRLPPTMWIKGPFHEHSKNIKAAFEREALFFSAISPALKIRCPGSYFADKRALLIEDLLARNASFGDCRRALPVAMVRDLLEMQARYHAFWWESPRLEALGEPSLKKDSVIERQFAPASWERVMAMPRSRGVTGRVRDRDTVMAGIERQLKVNEQLPECILHGDPHLGNMFFADGKPGLLDWQRTMRGAWIWDVAYMMVGSLTPQDRRAHEKELLRFYLQALSGHGVTAPSFADAWELYRINAFYGIIWVTVPEKTQREDVIHSMAARHSAAINDLWFDSPGGTTDLEKISPR